MFIDTHCHLFYEDYQNDISEVIARAESVGVKTFIVPATNHATAKRAIELAEKFPPIFVCIGFHPLDLEHYSNDHFKEIERMVSHPKVVAIGEIGIDYFYDTHSRDYQKEIFSLQIEFAIRKNLPIVVHTRDSMQDAIDIVTHYTAKNPEWRREGKRGVFHCFTGNAQQAKVLFDHQFFVSYPGPVTFKKNTAMVETLREIGIANLMVETDSPYLTPVPHRGKRNEPVYIPLIAQKIAEAVNLPVEEVARRTTINAQLLFHLPVEGS